MREMKTVIAVVVFALVACLETKATIILSDGFDSGIAPPWTFTGSWTTVSSTSGAHSGTKRASVSGPNVSGGDVLSLSISSVGYKNLILSYYIKITDSLEDNDNFFAEYTSDGGANWQILADYNNIAKNNWSLASFSLPASANDNPLFGFRFRAVFNSGSDEVGIDDFSLSGEPIPEPTSLLILLSMPFFSRFKFKL